jgi:chromosome segregation and condensation protein ScpB
MASVKVLDFVDSSLVFVVKHWKELLIIVLAALVVGKYRSDYKQLESTYEARQVSLEAQIDGLKNIHERELVRRAEALEDYKGALAELERNYLESQLELERSKREYREKYIEDFSENEDALIEEIEEVYGFENAP